MENSEEEMAVSISAVGAAAYVCCTVTFILLVCLLFFLGLTPTQRSDTDVFTIYSIYIQSKCNPSLFAKILGGILF